MLELYKVRRRTIDMSTWMVRFPTHFLQYIVVVEGGVDEVTELLKYSWGKVVFTGSERVGKVCCFYC